MHRYDPASKVVIESLMRGTPVITTVFDGAADLMQGGDCTLGRVLDDPADALAAAMTQWADPETRRLYEPNGSCAETLSMARHVQRLESIPTELRI